jgi:hypothetical protein
VVNLERSEGIVTHSALHLAPRQQNRLWAAISNFPPVAVGLAGAAMMAIEGRMLGTALVVLLVTLHRYSSAILGGRRLTIDQTADWTAIRVLTTICCLALPFYLALTIA